MHQPSLLINNSKKLTMSALLLVVGLGMVIGGSLVGGTQAMTTASPNGSTAQVQPYTGGAPVSKVFYPADGSTVTITKTGAVIKQSPGGTPYREGWVNPSNISSLTSAASLKGQLASGTSSPYVNNSSGSQPNNSGQSSAQPSNQPGSNNTTPAPQTSQTPASITSSTSTANAVANSNVILAGSGPTTSNAQTSSQAPAAQGSTTASASTPAQSSSNQNFSGKSLSNTGPGNVLAFSGIATVLGTISHFLFQRFRYRSLAS